MCESDREGWSNPEWLSYQQLVAGLHALDEEVEVEHEYEYNLNSGGVKKVDVVVWDHSDRYEETTLIECKFRDDPIEQEVVDSLIGVLNNSDANRGVIVAKSGFQSGAIERAEGTGIELWKLRFIRPEEDLEDLIQRVNYNIEVTEPQLEVVNMDLGAVDEAQVGRELQVTFTPENSSIYSTDREPTGETLLDRLTERINNVDEGEHTESFEDALVLIQGEFYELRSVQYRIEMHSSRTEFTYDLLDEVDLLFRNELTGTQEFVSLPEAFESFHRNVADDD